MPLCDIELVIRVGVRREEECLNIGSVFNGFITSTGKVQVDKL